MKTVIRRILTAITLLILWAAASAVLWGWVFGFLTETDTAHKLCVYADGTLTHATELAVRLERDMPEGIRMVKVRPFSYGMFDDTELWSGDLFIVHEKDLADVTPRLSPLPAALAGREDAYTVDGVPMALPLGNDLSRWMDCEPGTIWYLAFSAKSLHMAGHEGAVDDAALTAAQTLLTIMEEE